MDTETPLLQVVLTPFERRVMETLCQGKTNQFIAHETGQTLRAIENTITRTAKAFGVKGDDDTNVRVSLALAFRTYFGDTALQEFGAA